MRPSPRYRGVSESDDGGGMTATSSWFRRLAKIGKAALGLVPAALACAARYRLGHARPAVPRVRRQARMGAEVRIVLAATAGACCAGLLATTVSASAPRTYVAGDLPPIVSVRPPLGFGSYGDRNAYRFTPHKLASDFDATLAQAFKKASFQTGYTVSWPDGRAYAVAFVFRNTAGAGAGLIAFRQFERRHWRNDSSGNARDVPARGLGEQSWGLRVTALDSPTLLLAGEYGWRRSNLV